jgi:hypothetical protein
MAASTECGLQQPQNLLLLTAHFLFALFVLLLLTLQHAHQGIILLLQLLGMLPHNKHHVAVARCGIYGNIIPC